ncbi:MAG TPA: hypothetical protein VKJ07_24225 [Mycobacteriales bacterium]|nr:hypothetical protein [Mycobacteriales bacterium]
MTLAAPSGIQTAAGTLAFTAPPAWKTRPASSSMRVAEFVIPRADGDTEDAELIVYYFGTGAGTVDANIDRWIGQILQPDGSATKEKATRSSQTVNGLKVTTVDATGTYVAEMRPGATEHYNKPDFRLRAAVVETPRGPYYIKMTGPLKTMRAADAAFAAFLGSLRFAA